MLAHVFFHDSGLWSFAVFLKATAGRKDHADPASPPLGSHIWTWRIHKGKLQWLGFIQHCLFFNSSRLHQKRRHTPTCFKTNLASHLLWADCSQKPWQLLAPEKVGMTWRWHGQHMDMVLCRVDLAWRVVMLCHEICMFAMSRLLKKHPKFASPRCHKSFHSAGGDELFTKPRELRGAPRVTQLPHLETERPRKTGMNLMHLLMRIYI